MTTRFQPKGVPGGRLTPSNLVSTSTNSIFSPASPSTYGTNETDQAYLG